MMRRVLAILDLGIGKSRSCTEGAPPRWTRASLRWSSLSGGF